MNCHLILPSSMVKPMILHLFHHTNLKGGLKLWFYGPGDVTKDFDEYKMLHDILYEHMGAEVMKSITDIRRIEIPDLQQICSPGMGLLLGIADRIITGQLASDINPDDEVIILATSHLGLGMALAFKYHNLVRKSPRVITTIDINSPTSLANIELLYNEYNENIRIDIVASGKVTDILSVARAIEAVEPPDEPDGIYLTALPETVFYYKDTDLPTPVTAISMRTLMQLRDNLNNAKSSPKFLKKARVEKSFSKFPQILKFERALSNLEEYINSIRNDLRSEYTAEDMTASLLKVASQPEGCSSEYYCKAALKHILNCSFVVTSVVDEGSGATKIGIPEFDTNCVAFQDCLNPFAIAHATLDAFRNQMNHNVSLRSRCLDMWELFFKQNDKLTVRIEEIRLDSQSSNWSIYRTLPSSEIFFSQKAIYKVISSEGCIAITSPYTGFAVEKNIYSGEIKELSQRSKEFKQFIYLYVMNIPGFSEEFKEYVTSNCSTEELNLSGENLFQTYPQLRERIPIY